MRINLKSVIESDVRKGKTNIVYQPIYVESRKMVQMNLFLGQEDRHRHRKQTWGSGGGRRGVGQMEHYP